MNKILKTFIVLAAVVCCVALSGTVKTWAAEKPEGATAWNNTSALPTGPGYYYLTTDVTIAAPLQAGGAYSGGITLDLNGHNIISTGVTSDTGVMIVTNTGKVTITDTSDGQAGRLIGPSTQKYVVRVYGKNSAVLNFKAGNILASDNAMAASGCAVFLDTGTSTELRPEFNMSGGKIDGFSTSNSGAAVRTDANFAKINISGGVISNNTATTGGGAVYAGGKTEVNISGGTFSGNSAPVNGGALKFALGSTANISGGTFTGNKATTNSSAAGGVIFTAAGQDVYISGGTFTGNSSDVYGGAIYCQGVLHLSGNPVIKDNTAPTYPDVYVGKFEGTGNGSVAVSGLTEGADVYLSPAASFFSGLTPEGKQVASSSVSTDADYIHSTEKNVKAEYKNGIYFTKMPELSGNIVSAYITLDADLTFNFYAKYDSFYAEDIKLEVTRDGASPVYLTGKYNENGQFYNTYEFKYEGISAQYMADMIDLRLLYKGETVLDSVSHYSVKEYADKAYYQAGADDKLKTCLADLLEYGAAMQIYTGHNTSALANNPSWVSKSHTSEYTGPGRTARKVTQSKDPGTALESGTVYIDHINRIGVFINSDAPENITLKVLKNSEITDEIKLSELPVSGTRYGYFTEGIKPTDYDITYTFVLSNGSGELRRLNYSVYSYVYSMQNTDNETDKNAVRALYNYGASANAYAQAKTQVHDLTKTEFHVGPGQEWTSFTQCLIDLQDIETEKTVYIHPGIYDIFHEYRIAGVTRPPYDFNRADTANYTPYNVIVPPNTTIIGLGEQGDVRLSYMPDPAETYAAESWLVSPLNIAGTATVKNIDVYCRNGRYTIHDETLGIDKYAGAVKTYENVRSYKLKNQDGLGFGSGIGFGFDKLMEFTFTDCEFYNENGRPFYMHNRGRSIGGETYKIEDSAKITLNDCIIDAGNSTALAVFLGNSTGNLHHIVTMNNCQIRGYIKTANEGNNSLGTTGNCYDFRLDGCSEVKFQILNTGNKYPPVQTNVKPAWQ